MILFRQRLILMGFLSLISTYLLIMVIGGVSIIVLTSVEIKKEVFILAVYVVVVVLS